ncbi:hypothetical protein GCM10022227_18870 [Streptomyces sedi]
MHFERRIPSPVGWPVPAHPRRATPLEIAELIEKAKRRGDSRIGRGYVPVSQDAWCAITPIQYEESPDPAWICVFWQYGGRESYRLGISHQDFSLLDLLSRDEQVQAMQRLMLRASLGKRKSN